MISGGINPLGIKGLGEIGIVGVPAATANAVYRATGKRVRDLPITLDKLQRQLNLARGITSFLPGRMDNIILSSERVGLSFSGCFVGWPDQHIAQSEADDLARARTRNFIDEMHRIRNLVG